MSRKWMAAVGALIALPTLAAAQRGGGFGGGGATPENSAVFAPSAPTFPTADPIIRRIWTLGMDSSHTERFSQVLFDSLGPRLMGTPDLKRAQDWLVATYQSLGHQRQGRAIRHVARLDPRSVAHRPHRAARAHARRDDGRLQPGHRRQGRGRTNRSSCRTSPTARSS